jgi:hypothetical protein
MHVETPTRVVRTMARYKMTVVFDVHEEVKMKYVYQEDISKTRMRPLDL